MDMVKEMMIEGCSGCGSDRMLPDGCGIKCEDCGTHRCIWAVPGDE